MEAALYPGAAIGSLAAASVLIAIFNALGAKPRWVQCAVFMGPVAAYLFSLLWALENPVPLSPSGSSVFAELIRWSQFTPWWFQGAAVLLALTLVSFRLQNRPGFGSPNAQILILVSGVGCLSLISSSHLLVSLAAWPLAGLPLTLLCRDQARPNRSADAGKTAFFSDYFSFALMTLGTVLFYAQFQTLSLDALLDALQGETDSSDILLYTGSALILLGILTRIGALPFSLISEARAQSGTLAVSGLSLLLLPLSACAFAWNLFGEVLRPTLPQWQEFFILLGTATVWMGALGILATRSWRSFAAYLLVHQAGWIVLALAVPVTSLEPEIFFLILSNALALMLVLFAIAFLEKNHGQGGAEKMAGLARRAPALGFIVFTGLFVLGCFPPSLGFIARLLALSRLASTGSAGAAFLALGSTVFVGYACLTRALPLFAPSVHGEWVERARFETAIFWAAAAGLWLLAALPLIAWPG